ncbi:MAG TPA: hypothetical protein VN612_11985 [Acidobacteriaceae bacterium]|nr:hypothetical protein [Acidobacteriaceae bacterium]
MRISVGFAPLLLPVLALVAGCGGAGTSMTSTQTQPPNPTASLSGDWGALGIPTGTPPALASPISLFMGSLQFNGSSVSGTFRALPSQPGSCLTAITAQDLAVTGTYDSGSMTLTLTLPIAGGTASLSAPIAAAGGTYNAGSWQIVGGSCATGQTPMRLAQFASVTGTFTGTVSAIDLTTGMPVAGSGITLTATLTQSTAANADGQYPLTGTVTALGSCTGTYTLTNYVVSGGEVMPPPYTPFSFIGAADPSATLMVASLVPSSCPFSSYVGTLTRQ